MKSIISIVVLFLSITTFAKGAPAKKIFFVEPKDGAVVTSPLKIKMGVKGMKVCEANIETKDKKCGHHHLLIDKAAIPAGQVVPKDEMHLHYGKKQTDAEIALTPGKHTLTLQFADFAHLSYGEEHSAAITVEVKDAPASAPVPTK